MPEVPPITLTPLTKFRVQVAVSEQRVRRAVYTRHLLSLTLTDGTILKLSSEHEVIIALRCLTSAAHAGKSAIDARADERTATMRVTTGVK